MRKPTTVLMTALLVITLAAPAFAKTEVTGLLIDMACYAQDKEDTGNHHEGKGLMCARACALNGFPVGLLAAGGKVYQVMGALAASSNAKLVPYMAHTVTLTGDVSEKDGQLIIVASDLKMIR